MTAFVNVTDPILVQLNHTWDGAGNNYIDNRSVWYNLNDPSVSLFGTDGTVATSTWIRDNGAPDMSAALQEPRAFCLAGEISFTFTGTSVVARLNTDYGWSTGATVLIDGVAPSTLGLLTALDSISFSTSGPTNTDVLIADGLSAGSHTVTIKQNGSGSAFMSFVGFKVRTLASLPLTISDISILPAADKATFNEIDVTLIVEGANTVLNPKLTFPTGAVTDLTASAFTTVTGASIDASTPISQGIIPDMSANTPSGTLSIIGTLSGEYPDPSGTIIQSTTTTLLANDPALNPTSGWSIDNSTPTSETRIFTNTYGAAYYLTFTFEGDELDLRVEQDYGWGAIGIYAADNATLLNGTATSSNPSTTAMVTYNLTGFGPGSHTVFIRKLTNDTNYIVIASAAWAVSKTFTEVLESVDFSLIATQPIPLPVTGITQGEFGLDFPAVDTTLNSISSYPARTNSGVTSAEILERFPTFAVCYQKGYRAILGEYDIVIVDPFAADAADVQYWQSLGIKVFGYISLGEEDAFYTNRYDTSSPVGPWPGDGTGPGGTAGYFMKGGYGSREVSECQNDNQALGTKSCALTRAEYFTGVGRCGLSCLNDSVSGYSAYSSGGACAAGYTKANNWIRPNANTACTNTACPKFSPVNGKATGTTCPKYAKASNAYLQDFSIATPNAPDENGIWNSWYTNPDPTKGWLARITDYYAPTVLGGPVVVSNESVTVKSGTVAGVATMVFDTAKSPIDDTAPITLTNAANTITYSSSSDFSFDMKTGAFAFKTGIANMPTVGEVLTISYTKKGHVMDGIFMDTIDDADVYPYSGSLMSSLVASLKGIAGANTILISNRGFSNLNDYIQHCHGVMFESWLTDYDSNTASYFAISDPSSVSYNDAVNAQLLELRGRHVFDVYSLNYCAADSTGDPLRAYCREQDTLRGYMSWTSTIDLNVPMSNVVVETPNSPIKTNGFVAKMKRGF